MLIGILLTVLGLVHIGCSLNSPPRFWFSTPSPISEVSNIDFRGCYGPECVYVSSKPLPGFPSKTLGVYNPSQRLWALSKSSDSVVYKFSLEFPEEEAAIWAVPVADRRIIPATFNASLYNIEPDPHVAEFIGTLDIDRIKATINTLSSYNSRNSYSPDTKNAATWLAESVAAAGCKDVEVVTFRSTMAPNVYCVLPGTDATAKPVVVGAHYDSRATNVNSPTQRAPGADDNGSGSAAVLEILTTAGLLTSEEGFSFESTIVFAFFAGEEQGLVGSSALASQYVSDGKELTAMVNLDMIAYPDPSNPETLYWMSGATTLTLTTLAIDLTKTYLGESTLIAKTSACCSDQQSFYSNGFPAASIFESRSASSNPNYHQSSDTPSTLDYDHLLRNAKSAAALITTLAKLTGPLRK